MAEPGARPGRVVGFDCEFVQAPPEHFVQSECPICLLIIRDPHQVTCCGNKFCQSCIQHIKSDKKPCPTCKAKKIKTFPDVGAKRILYSLKVICSHQKDGCEWTGELGQLDGHLNTDPQPEKQLSGCQFEMIICIYNCGDQLQRGYIQTHQSEHCTKRPFSCEHCHNYESHFSDVTKNHWPVCGSFPLNCPNKCGLKIQRQNVDSHVAEECPLTTISCDFLHVGCAVKPPRKDMPEHLRENLLTHISLLATSHAKQQAVITQQAADNNELKSEITNLKQSVLSHETKIAALQTEVTSFQAKVKRMHPYKARDDFLNDVDYGHYIKSILKPGMKVRARERYERVAEGDYGIYRQTSSGDPPAQFMWEGLGETYWVFWHQVELI